MLTYIVRRLLSSIPVLVVASFLIFTFSVKTADPLGAIKMNPRGNLNRIAIITKKKHLDKSLMVRYGYWVKDAFTNQFGTTVVNDRPIWPDLKRVLGHTLQLLLAAEIFSVLFAILVGVYSAIRQYSFFDYTATTFSFLGLAVPVFWLALILQLLFTTIYNKWGLRIFYTGGLSEPGVTGWLHTFTDRVQHLALPVVTLVVVSVAGYSRFMRASMLEVINSDYVRTARAKGLDEARVIMRHAFRNALIPLTTLVALDFGLLFGGAVVTETIFALDGMGLYFIHALQDGDPYPLMAWLMVTATMIVIGNLLADVIYGYLDPRIRYD